MKYISSLFIFLLLILGISSIENNADNKTKKKVKHFCGVDYIKNKFPKNTNSQNKANNSKYRKLSTEFLPVRILVDTTYLEIQAKEIEGFEDKLPLIKSALNKSVESLGKLLEVEQYTYNFLSDLIPELITNNSIYKWDERINNTEKISQDYDYVLFPRFVKDSDGFPNEVLAAANPFLLDKNTHRPIAGILIITKNPYYYEKGNIEKYLSNLFIHELTHAFGFLSDAFQYFPEGKENSIFSKVDNYGILRHYVKSPKVFEFAKKYYGCDSLEGVEVENQGSSGSIGSHWEARTMLGEYMTSETYEDEVAISDFTLYFFEDSGWYKTNHYTGGLFRFGKNKGCDFLNNYCLLYDFNKSVYYTQFNDEFFALDMRNYPSCTTGRQSRAYNLINYYPFEIVQNYSKILATYGNMYVGGLLYSADFCPVTYHYNQEYEKSYFVGNCKNGNGDYGRNLYYKNSEGQFEINHTNSELPKELGEKYSENSFCMMSNLVLDDGNFSIYGSIFHPMCFPSFCSSSSLTVLIYDQYIVCPRSGGNVEVKGYKGKLHCPDYNLICTGTVMCNDLFDCIDKKSEAKDSTFSYDYKPDATQRYIEIENGKTFYAAELADDGVCPKNCIQCLENKKCKICLDGFNLIGEKENDDQPIICDNTINVKKGYYLKDNVYYLCHSNCETCSSGPVSDKEMNCDECIEGLYYHEETKNCDGEKDGESEEETKEEEHEEETEEEEHEEEEQNDEVKPKSNTFTIVIIGIVVLVVIILFIIILMLCLKRKRLTSDNVDIINNQEKKDAPLYES